MVSVKTLFRVQLGKADIEKVVLYADAAGKRVAVAADAAEGKSRFSFFEKIAFKQRHEKYIFVSGREKRQREKVVSVFGGNGNVGAAVFGVCVKIQLFKQTHIVQFVLGVFIGLRGKRIPGF